MKTRWNDSTWDGCFAVSAILVLALLCGCKYFPSDWTVPTIPGTVTNAPACSCDLSNPLCEPDKGEECPVPFGMDIRFLAWSPSKGDWVFIGYTPASCTLDGKMLTGNCFQKNGKQYHYEGQRQKSSSATMITDRAVEVKQTHRVYYRCYEL